MPFPQYRIPVERLKEDWAFRLRMDRLRRKRPKLPPSEITDNSEPWIRNPSSVADEIGMVRVMAAEGDPFAHALLENRQIPYSGS